MGTNHSSQTAFLDSLPPLAWTPHNLRPLPASLTSPNHLPSGVKRRSRSLTSQPLRCIIAFPLSGHISFNSTLALSHSIATICGVTQSPEHPSERSPSPHRSRRLATTCSSLQHREHAQQRGYAMQHTSHHLQRVTPVAVQSFLIWCPWLAEPWASVLLRRGMWWCWQVSGTHGFATQPWASVLLRGGCGGVRTASGAHGCDLKSQGGDQVVALRQYQSNSSHQSTSPHVRVADV